MISIGFEETKNPGDRSKPVNFSDAFSMCWFPDFQYPGAPSNRCLRSQLLNQETFTARFGHWQGVHPVRSLAEGTQLDNNICSSHFLWLCIIIIIYFSCFLVPHFAGWDFFFYVSPFCWTSLDTKMVQKVALCAELTVAHHRAAPCSARASPNGRWGLLPRLGDPTFQQTQDIFLRRRSFEQ